MTPEHKDSAEPAPCPLCDFKPPFDLRGVFSHDCFEQIHISEWNRVARAPGALRRLYDATYRAKNGGSDSQKELNEALEEARKCL